MIIMTLSDQIFENIMIFSDYIFFGLSIAQHLISNNTNVPAIKSYKNNRAEHSFNQKRNIKENDFMVVRS